MTIEISVIVIVHNEENYLDRSVMSILNQTHKNFELIVVDDCSDDRTFEKLIKINDKRLKVIRNEGQIGPAESRNRGVEKARGKYIFFTDADCYPNKNWLEEGLKSFKRGNCLGVEGRIIMSKETGSISEKIVKNLTGGEYMTGNIAYGRDILKKIGRFDPEFNYYYEDREIAFRVLKFGDIAFNKKMMVKHQLKRWNMLD